MQKLPRIWELRKTLQKELVETKKEYHYQTIQKKLGGKYKSRSKAKEGKQEPTNSEPQSNLNPSNIIQRPVEGALNPFNLLDNDKEYHEGEETQEEQEEGEIPKESTRKYQEVLPEPPPLLHSNYPIRIQISSPSYAKMAKRRTREAISTSEEEPFEKYAKRQGRKSNR